MKQHPAHVAFFKSLGLTPVVDGNQITLVNPHDARPVTAGSSKALVAAVKAEIAAGTVWTRKLAKGAKSGVVFLAYKRAYRATDGHCGDSLAEALREATLGRDDDGNTVVNLDDLLKIATRNGIDADCVFKAKNPGLARMNLSNILRARVRRGEKVKVPGFQGEPTSVNAPKCWGPDIWASAGPSVEAEDADENSEAA